MILEDTVSDIPKCIICLHDIPTTITYSGLCECHPQIHEQCLASWFGKNPGECPICRKTYSIIIQPDYTPQRPIGVYICCCIYIFSIFIIPFTIIFFLAIKRD